MLRKKNITLNGKKAEGRELLKSGDKVILFLSDETWKKFGGPDALPDAAHPVRETLPPAIQEPLGRTENTSVGTSSGCDTARDTIRTVPALVPGVCPPAILYQDEHILLLNKPAGILSQKAAVGDVSLVEYLNAYLLESACMTPEEMQLVHPAVCNRLDRNTSGLVVAGISLAGLQTMNRLLADRSVRKFYRCIVCGRMSGEGCLRGYLKKDERTNTVTVYTAPTEGAKEIRTGYRVIASKDDLSLLEVHLITGRSHQIRAHLASTGHPILGDPKYGDPVRNRQYLRSCGVKGQLLHAYRLEFPDIEGLLSYLSGQTFCAPVPEIFERLIPCRQ